MLTWVLGSVSPITDSSDRKTAALFRSEYNPGEENYQIHDKTHLSNEIRLRNKFKVVVFLPLLLASISLLTLHFLTFKNASHDQEMTSQGGVHFTLCSCLTE